MLYLICAVVTLLPAFFTCLVFLFGLMFLFALNGLFDTWPDKFVRKRDKIRLLRHIAYLDGNKDGGM